MSTVTEPPDVETCHRCGYDLRGIANEQPCPECGLLAERSRHLTDELHDTRPRWLRNMSVGIWMILLGLIVSSFWDAYSDQIETAVRQYYLFAVPGWLGPLYITIPLFGLDIGAIFLLIGVWLMTLPEGYAPGDRSDRWRRRLLRVLTGSAVVVLAGIHLLLQLSSRLGVSAELGDILLNTVNVIAVLVIAPPIPVLIFSQLRGIAKRAHSAHLAEHCVIAGVGSAVASFCLGALIILTRRVDWWLHSTISLVITLAAGVAGGLFLLWSMYLLIRFAIAFWLASRRLRRTWKRDDRAISPE